MSPVFVICLALMALSIGIAIGLAFGETRKNDDKTDE
jgi:hypothetical protein